MSETITIDDRPTNTKIVVKRRATVEDLKTGLVVWVDLWGFKIREIESYYDGWVYLTTGESVSDHCPMYLTI